MLDESRVKAEAQGLISISPEIDEMQKEKHRIKMEIERTREPRDEEVYKKVTQLVLGAHTVTQKKLVAADSEPGQRYKYKPPKNLGEIKEDVRHLRE